MKRYEAIERKYWINSETGQKVSIYGAVPYISEAEKAQWKVETNGWVYRDNKTNQVRGKLYTPYSFKDKEEVEAFIVALEENQRGLYPIK